MLTNVLISSSTYSTYKYKIFKWYYDSLISNKVYSTNEIEEERIAEDLINENNYRDLVKTHILESIQIYKTIYGPYYSETTDETFQADLCDTLEPTIEEKDICDASGLDLSENETSVDKMILKRDEQISHYVQYTMARFFESQILISDNITDWLMEHLELETIGNIYDIFTFINMEGKILPTIEDLENIEIPISSEMLGRFGDGMSVVDFGPMKSSGIISALLLIRDKVVAAKTSLLAIQSSLTTISGSLSTLSSSLTSLSSVVNTINTSLTSLSGTVASHTSSISTLTSSVSTNTSAIATINTSLTSLSSTVSSHTSSIATNTSSLSTLNTSVSGINTKLNTINNLLHLW